MRTTTRKQITIAVDYDLGDIVFLRVCSDKSAGMVTGIFLTPAGATYTVTWENGVALSHYAMELSSEYMPPDWGENNR